MKISIWGNELSGWVSAAALAESGNEILLVPYLKDSNSSGGTKFNISNESGLENLVNEQQELGRLMIAEKSEGIKHGSIHIFAFYPDQYAEAELILTELATTYSHDLLIINQANFGVGSSEKLQSLLTEANNQVIAYMPDMLAEGSALKDFKSPTTFILGCENNWALLTIRALFRPFTREFKQWLIMSSKEAEFSKFANIGMLALRLGYINELANMAGQLDVDIEVVREAMITDPRIGPHYLNPGCGFGGLHFQQYIEALSELMTVTRNSKLLDTVLIENEKQKEQPFRKIWRYYQCDLTSKTVSIWGISFKPGTASIENAPSLKVIDALLAQNCTVQIHDPEALNNVRNYFGDRQGLKYCCDSYEALQNSDGLLLLTDWPEYASPDYERMLNLMTTPLIIDGRNVFDTDLLTNLGFIYDGVGR
ncbi:MAG: nucleotide sugar dehydrogenase [Neptuniibacter sp.]